MAANAPTGQQRYASLIEWAKLTIAYSRAIASPEYTAETFDMVIAVEEQQAEAILNGIREEIRARCGSELSYTAAAMELIPAVLEATRKKSRVVSQPDMLFTPKA